MKYSTLLFVRLALCRHNELFDGALTTLGGEFEFCFSTGVIFSSCRLILANTKGG